MATGVYGNVRGADVSLDDMQIFLHYTPSRASAGDGGLTELDPTEILQQINNPNGLTGEILGGLYNMVLPTSIFGAKGIYTVYIKPAEIRTRIVDCGVLAAFPDTKGLVFDISAVPSRFASRFENNGLIGYRIEYLNPDNNNNEVKIRNLFRVITSNNKCEPVNQNLTNTNQKAIRYNFNDNSTLTFATVTPNSASNVKPNSFPFIGQPNQEVIITNTFFDPVVVEIEMVEHDTESLAIALYGPQSKSLEDSIYTVYNFNNEIYRQWDLYEIKDRFSGKPLFEVREIRNNIDFDKTFDNITNI